MKNKSLSVTNQELRGRIHDFMEAGSIAFLDGFDDCIVGVLDRPGKRKRLVYNQTAVLAKIMADGVEPEQAKYFLGRIKEQNLGGMMEPVFVEVITMAKEVKKCGNKKNGKRVQRKKQVGKKSRRAVPNKKGGK